MEAVARKLAIMSRVYQSVVFRIWNILQEQFMLRMFMAEPYFSLQKITVLLSIFKKKRRDVEFQIILFQMLMLSSVLIAF